TALEIVHLEALLRLGTLVRRDARRDATPEADQRSGKRRQIIGIAHRFPPAPPTLLIHHGSDSITPRKMTVPMNGEHALRQTQYCVSLTGAAPRAQSPRAMLRLFVPGRLCLFGEHSDWAGSLRTVDADIVAGMCI